MTHFLVDFESLFLNYRYTVNLQEFPCNLVIHALRKFHCHAAGIIKRAFKNIYIIPFYKTHLWKYNFKSYHLAQFHLAGFFKSKSGCFPIGCDQP